MASTTMSSHWETVGKAKKGSKIPHYTRTEKKHLIENMPRIEQQAPLKESATLYDAFLEKERKSYSSQNKENKPLPKENSKSSNDTKKTAGNKKKKEQEKKVKVSIEEAVAKIAEAEVKSTLALTQTTFPDNIEVWLKDLASFLNLKLEQVPDTDPVFKGKPKNFPLCLLTSKCQNTISKVIREASSDTMDHLFYHCLATMLTELNKDNGTSGYRIFLQLLVKVKPDIVLQKLPQYNDLLNTNSNRSSRSLTILWSLGQCGHLDLESGLRVWIEVMQPALKIRPAANYCVEYLEELLSGKHNMKNVNGKINLREYFHLVDLIYGDRQLPTELSKKLQALYPQLKSIAYSGSTVSTRSLFPSYLMRAKPDCPKLMKTVLMSSLIDCLARDKQCYSVWVQMYTKYLMQSSVLIQHLLDNWGTVGSKLDRKLLKETLRSFSITNEELTGSGKGNRDVEGLGKCTVVSKDLLLKLEEARFPWFWIMFLLVSVVSAIVAYDVYFSPTVKKSRTMRFMEDYGVIAFTEQVWGRVGMYYTKAHMWLSVNVPFYYGKVSAAVGPYILVARTKISEYYIQVMDVSEPFRNWVTLKFFQCTNKIYELSPETWTRLRTYFWLSWDFFTDYSVWIWGQLVQYLYICSHWIEDNIILSKYTPQSLQKLVYTAVSSFNSTSTAIFRWATQLFAASPK